MAQDIRELFKKERGVNTKKMPGKHQDAFLKLLDNELPIKQKYNPYFFIKIAASVVLLVTMGIVALNFTEKKPVEKVTVIDRSKDNSLELVSQLTLGNISPELKVIENYYATNINLELLDLKVDGENKKIIDMYLNKLGELNIEYKKLTNELNEVGPNEQTINALINNLQLRLQLLEQLKEKLKEFKNTKNEIYTNPQV